MEPTVGYKALQEFLCVGAVDTTLADQMSCLSRLATCLQEGAVLYVSEILVLYFFVKKI